MDSNGTCVQVFSHIEASLDPSIKAASGSDFDDILQTVEYSTNVDIQYSKRRYWLRGTVQQLCQARAIFRESCQLHEHVVFSEVSGVLHPIVRETVKSGMEDLLDLLERKAPAKIAYSKGRYCIKGSLQNVVDAELIIRDHLEGLAQQLVVSQARQHATSISCVSFYVANSPEAKHTSQVQSLTQQTSGGQKLPVQQSNEKQKQRRQQTSEVHKAPIQQTSEVRKAPTQQTGEVRKAPTQQTGEVRKAPTQQTGEVQKAPTQQTSEVRKAPTQQTSENHKAPTQQTGEVRKAPTQQTGEVRKAPTQQTGEVRKAPTQQTGEVRNSPTQQTSENHKAPTQQTSEVRKAPTQQTGGIPKRPGGEIAGSQKQQLQQASGGQEPASQQTARVHRQPAQQTSEILKQPARQTSEILRQPVQQTNRVQKKQEQESGKVMSTQLVHTSSLRPPKPLSRPEVTGEQAILESTAVKRSPPSTHCDQGTALRTDDLPTASTVKHLSAELSEVEVADKHAKRKNIKISNQERITFPEKYDPEDNSIRSTDTPRQQRKAPREDTSIRCDVSGKDKAIHQLKLHGIPEHPDDRHTGSQSHDKNKETQKRSERDARPKVSSRYVRDGAESLAKPFDARVSEAQSREDAKVKVPQDMREDTKPTSTPLDAIQSEREFVINKRAKVFFPDVPEKTTFPEKPVDANDILCRGGRMNTERGSVRNQVRVLHNPGFDELSHGLERSKTPASDVLKQSRPMLSEAAQGARPKKPVGTISQQSEPHGLITSNEKPRKVGLQRNDQKTTGGTACRIAAVAHETTARGRSTVNYKASSDPKARSYGTSTAEQDIIVGQRNTDDHTRGPDDDTTVRPKIRPHPEVLVDSRSTADHGFRKATSDCKTKPHEDIIVRHKVDQGHDITEGDRGVACLQTSAEEEIICDPAVWQYLLKVHSWEVESIGRTYAVRMTTLEEEDSHTTIRLTGRTYDVALARSKMEMLYAEVKPCIRMIQLDVPEKASEEQTNAVLEELEHMFPKMVAQKGKKQGTLKFIAEKKTMQKAVDYAERMFRRAIEGSAFRNSAVGSRNQARNAETCSSQSCVSDDPPSVQIDPANLPAVPFDASTEEAEKGAIAGLPEEEVSEAVPDVLAIRAKDLSTFEAPTSMHKHSLAYDALTSAPSVDSAKTGDEFGSICQKNDQRKYKQLAKAKGNHKQNANANQRQIDKESSGNDQQQMANEREKLIHQLLEEGGSENVKLVEQLLESDTNPLAAGGRAASKKEGTSSLADIQTITTLLYEMGLNAHYMDADGLRDTQTFTMLAHEFGTSAGYMYADGIRDLLDQFDTNKAKAREHLGANHPLCALMDKVSTIFDKINALEAKTMPPEQEASIFHGPKVIIAPNIDPDTDPGALDTKSYPASSRVRDEIIGLVRAAGESLPLYQRIVDDIMDTPGLKLDSDLQCMLDTMGDVKHLIPAFSSLCEDIERGYYPVPGDQRVDNIVQVMNQMKSLGMPMLESLQQECGVESPEDHQMCKNPDKKVPENSKDPGKEDPESFKKPGKEDPESSKNPGKEDPESSKNPGKEDPESSKNPGKEDPESSKNPSKEDPESSKNPGKENPESSKNPGKEDPESSKNPLKEDPKSSKNPGKEDPESSKNPGKEDPESSKNPGKEDPESSKNPGKEGPASSKNPGKK